ERPFNCPECSMTFSRKHDLRRHTRSLHSGDRPHLCSHCNQSFARSDALKRHLSSEAKRCDAAGIPFTMPAIASDPEASDGAAGPDDHVDDLDDDDKGSRDGDGDTDAHAAADLPGSPATVDADPFDALAAAAAAAPRAAG
ncbi:hypothetical protein HK405_010382, partial [Cladochytrium tenue]